MRYQTPVALSLGANIGDIRRNLGVAIENLEFVGLAKIVKSSIYRTRPVGFDMEVPDFLNTAIIGEWPGSVSDLHDECKKIEVSLGRPETHETWTSRTLDLDIILFGSEIISSSSLTIPHPEAVKRFFVLSPLNEIASDWIFPDTGTSVAESFVGLCAGSYESEMLNIVPW